MGLVWKGRGGEGGLVKKVSDVMHQADHGFCFLISFENVEPAPNQYGN